MEKSVIKYLADFSLCLEDLYGDTIDVRRMFRDADSGKLNIVDSMSWLEDFKKTLTCLQRILGHEHLHVKFLKELVKVQVASRIDQEGFAMTLREPRVWKKSDTGLRPEEVYTTLYEDEYAIYENRFIKMLIDAMIDYLTAIRNEIGESLGTVQTYFSSKIMTASALRIKEKYNTREVDDERILAVDGDPVVELYNDVDTMLRKIKHFKSSRLYKECAKKPPIIGPIQPTNILTKDYSYRVCYLFYKRLAKMRNHEKDVVSALRTNGLLRILYALNKSGYRLMRTTYVSKISEDLYGIDSITMQNNFVRIQINTLGAGELLFNISMRVIDKSNPGQELSPRFKSSVLLKFTDATPKAAEKIVEEYRKEKLRSGIYDEAYVAIYSRKPAEADGVFNFANKGDFGSRMVEDFIRSLTMQLDGSHKIFSKRCPICGNRYAGEGDVHTCFYCESKWSLVEELGAEKVWLKRIRKEQKDDDEDEFEEELAQATK